MDSFMCFEATNLCEGVITLFASKRLLTTMNLHVSFEATNFCVGVITLVASKRLFTTMNSHVSFQSAGLFACVAALVAAVGFGMFFQMITWSMLDRKRRHFG